MIASVKFVLGLYSALCCLFHFCYAPPRAASFQLAVAMVVARLRQGASVKSNDGREHSVSMPISLLLLVPSFFVRFSFFEKREPVIFNQNLLRGNERWRPTKSRDNVSKWKRTRRVGKMPSFLLRDDTNIRRACTRMCSERRTVLWPCFLT